MNRKEKTTNDTRSVGIIGGLGPETTAEFYLEVIFLCQKADTKSRPLIVTSSVPMPLEIERNFIEKNAAKELIAPLLITEAKRLERSGVDFLVMPCNSLHILIQEIRDAVTIPVLSIIEETTDFLKERGFRRVGLISTSATIVNNVYETTLTENNIDFVTPDELQRVKLDQIIQRLIHGQHLNKDREFMLDIAADLSAQDVECVILACTDLQLLLPKSKDIPMFDTMKILADSTAGGILSHKELPPI